MDKILQQQCEQRKKELAGPQVPLVKETSPLTRREQQAECLGQQVEEKMLMARDTARDEAQKLHRKWLKHQAFMAELARNKEWLAKIEQEGQELIQEKPELRSVVQQKLEEIRECWSDLESTTKAKARQLFENNKPEPAVKSYSDLDNQLSHLEQQPPQLEQAHHLPTFNEQLQKFQAMESQIGDFYKDVGSWGAYRGSAYPSEG
ncbi:hypothetical protein Q5P01_019912 [Channa striata]|uniref:Uncharacterized protein n=1 Tax=Channa striata TaxID=64152 RepID=A0AA88M3C5_CHASR|nr:hypothetical protein Q5P01_019912 [Channa striata]